MTAMTAAAVIAAGVIFSVMMVSMVVALNVRIVSQFTGQERCHSSIRIAASPIFHSSCEGKLGIALE